MATAATPCTDTRASACAIARTSSQGPGSRRPSQHRAPRRSETHGRLAVAGHAAGLERGKIGSGAPGHRWCGRAGRPRPRARPPSQPCPHRVRRAETVPSRTRAAGPLDRPARCDRSSFPFPSLGNSASDVPRKSAVGQPGRRWRRGPTPRPARRPQVSGRPGLATRPILPGARLLRGGDHGAVAAQRGEVLCCS